VEDAQGKRPFRSLECVPVPRPSDGRPWLSRSSSNLAYTKSPSTNRVVGPSNNQMPDSTGESRLIEFSDTCRKDNCLQIERFKRVLAYVLQFRVGSKSTSSRACLAGHRSDETHFHRSPRETPGLEGHSSDNHRKNGECDPFNALSEAHVHEVTKIFRGTFPNPANSGRHSDALLELSPDRVVEKSRAVREV
jgi:hypothetical protein